MENAKHIVKRVFEEPWTGNFEAIDEFISPDYIGHDPAVLNNRDVRPFSRVDRLGNVTIAERFEIGVEQVRAVGEHLGEHGQDRLAAQDHLPGRLQPSRRGSGQVAAERFAEHGRPLWKPEGGAMEYLEMVMGGRESR